MKKISLLIPLIYFTYPSLAQKHSTIPPAKKNWVVNPFDNNKFIENMGQFNADVKTNDKILYQVKLGSIKGYFTPDGVIYEYDKYPKVKKGDDPDKKENITPEHLYLRVEWDGANPQTSVSGKQEVSYYCTYYTGGKNIKANAFKKIVYHNLYPGIDAEYSFPEGEKGIKYALIVHPGADISHVKLKYYGATGLKTDSRGNILVSSPLGYCTDHAPVCYYQDGGSIETKYVRKGSEESFLIKSNYDKNKTIVIDPLITWTTDPSFWNYDNAYDVDYDYLGNIYVYGGGGPFELVQLNSSGVIQWQYYTPFYGYYGDIAVDKSTGTSFLVDGFSGSNGAEILKIGNQGNFVNEQVMDTNINEMWRAVYDPCQHDIVVAAGGYATDPGESRQALTLDTNLNLISAPNVLSVARGYHDMTLLSLDPSNSTICYMATATSTGDNQAIANNVLVKLPVPGLIPTQYEVSDGYKFEEVGSINYNSANGMSGMAASPNWLYLYDGSTLGRFDKNTGAFIANTVLNTPSYGFDGQIMVDWGGLDVDACDHIYAGLQTSVVEYDSSLSLVSTTPLPLNTDTVYDVVLGNTDTLYACGLGFVSSMTVATPACTPVIPSLKLISSSDSFCTQPYLTIIAPAGGTSYAWSGPCISGPSNQQTVQVTCPGTYSVVITGILGPPTCNNVTLTINIPSGTGGPPVPSFHADTVCYGNSTQFVNTSIPLSGTGVKFYWDFYNTGIYEDSTTNPLWAYPDPGTYHVRLHELDSNGCGADTIVNVMVDTTPPSTILFDITSCLGQPTQFYNYSSDTSTVQYIWNFGDPSSGSQDSSTSTSPVHTFDTAGTYTVTLRPRTSIQCHDSATKILHISPLPSDSIVYNYTCGDTVVTFYDVDSTGIVFSRWKIYDTYTGIAIPNSTYDPSITINFPDTGTYTVKLHAFNASYCYSVDSIQITMNKPTAAFSVHPLSVCSGDSVHFTDSTYGGGAISSWKWNFGDPSSGINDSSLLQNSSHIFSSGGTYTVTLKIVTVQGCIDSMQKTVNINQSPVVGIVPPSPTICVGDSVSLLANGATNYTWKSSTGLNCTNCSNPNAGPGITTTYTVTGNNASGCTDSTTVTVTVVSKVTPLISGKDTICYGDSVQLTASGGTSYSWNTGATTTAITVKPAATSTYTLTASNGICSDSTEFTVTIDSLPKATITPSSIICQGSAVVLTATGGGTYLWSNSATTSSITVNPANDTSYSVVVTNGMCSKDTAVTITVTPLPTVIISPDTSICGGNSVTLNVSGGGTYLWSNSATTSSITVAPANTTNYSVVVTNGTCNKDTTVNVTVTPYPTVAITPDTSICAGNSITLNVSGGGTYLWSNSATSSSISVNPANTTNYSVVVSNGMCSKDTAVNVTVTPLPTVAITSDTSICSGKSVTLNVSGGGTYLWSNSATSSSISVNPANTTSYSVVVTNSICSKDTAVVVTVTPLPTITITPDTSICAGKSVTLYVSGGGTYLWSNTSTTDSITVTPSSNTTYTAMVTKNGCSKDTTITVSINDLPVINITSPQKVCAGESIILAATGGGNYLWNTGATTDSITVTAVSDTNYSVIVSNGCTDSAFTSVSVVAPSLFACCDTIIQLGDSTYLNSNGAGIIKYNWSPDSGLNCDTCPSVIATPTATTTYTVIGTDSLGCTIERTVVVTVEMPCVDLTVPNVFTPDNSGTYGLDNYFYIKTSGLSSWLIIIYDRWGKEIFRSTNPDTYWGGATESGGQAPAGVYYYIIQATCQGDTYKKEGFVQLIR